MKHTRIEIIVQTIMWGVVAFLAGFGIFAVRTCSEVQSKGLKAVITETWEGKP